MRVLYRLRQFWRALTEEDVSPAPEQVCALLNPQQVELFTRLQTAEKTHALRVFHKLISQGEQQPDLLVAALLHDVGKLRYHLHPVERAMVVLVGAFMPGVSHRLGRLPASGWESVASWRRAFVVAEQHAIWGAELARQAGASSLTEALIRAHHHPDRFNPAGLDSSLLHKLWAVDNES